MLRFITRSMLCLTLATLAGAAEAAESIAYRLSDWKEMHFDDDPGKAAQHLAAVQKLGCEVQPNSEAGHADVVYRSVKWQVLEVADEKLAHQWEAWLKGSGFETIHGHAEDHEHGDHKHGDHEHGDHEHGDHEHADDEHADDEHGDHEHGDADHDHDGHEHGPGEIEEVTYRLADWKTMHIENRNQLPELIALMKGFGCEIRSDEHAEHEDIGIRCRQWKTIEVSSHKIAQGWEAWLKKNGFEVRHNHPPVQPPQPAVGAAS